MTHRFADAKAATRYFFALLVSDLLPVVAYGLATVFACAAIAALTTGAA